MTRMVRRITTRGYELDTNATVSASTLMRYMEHMRWESARDPALNLGRMFEDGYRMVVRAQQLEVDAFVSQEEALDVTMDLGHVGNASMDMLHDLVRVRDGTRVARGVVTAVYLDPQWNPHRIPESFRSRSAAKERTVIVSLSEGGAPADCWSRRFTVVPSDLDLFQHVNHARYLDFFDDTRRMAADAKGYGSASARAAGPLFRAVIDYRRQVLPGERTISTWLLSPEGDSMGFELRGDDDQVLSRCRIEVR